MKFSVLGSQFSVFWTAVLGDSFNKYRAEGFLDEVQQLSLELAL